MGVILSLKFLLRTIQEKELEINKFSLLDSKQNVEQNIENILRIKETFEQNKSMPRIENNMEETKSNQIKYQCDEIKIVKGQEETVNTNFSKINYDDLD